MSEPIIDVRNLQKTYWVHQRKEGLTESLKSIFHRSKTAVKAVKDISFSIEPGEIVGFLGPNGAGKTTTLKALSGLLHPTSGEVVVAGHVPKQREYDFLHKITLVMGQKQQLIWDLPAADSFKLNQVLYSIPDHLYRKNLSILTDMLDIGDVVNTPQRNLSLGERMKCELAAAMLHNPQVLFLDEPTIGMDINIQQKVRQFIADYRQEFGATVLLTSHYMADVTALADRILVIDEGNIIFQGTNQDLIRRFSTRKLLKLHFETSVEDVDLIPHGDFHRSNSLEAGFYAERGMVSDMSIQLLNDLPVKDITIEEEPFEEVLNRLFDHSRNQ